jgi:hypothetical protein
MGHSRERKTFHEGNKAAVVIGVPTMREAKEISGLADSDRFLELYVEPGSKIMRKSKPRDIDVFLLWEYQVPLKLSPGALNANLDRGILSWETAHYMTSGDKILLVASL